MTKLLTRAQAAEKLGLQPQTLALWAANRRYDLPMVKLGKGVVRYLEEDVDAFARRHRVDAPAQA